ncbi:MAG: hypothetical protein R3B74_08415 [Nitrospirales bacterium]|nr:hypothetical protein [Nitrospirales bacterium]
MLWGIGDSKKAAPTSIEPEIHTLRIFSYVGSWAIDNVLRRVLPHDVAAGFAYVRILGDHPTRILGKKETKVSERQWE